MLNAIKEVHNEPWKEVVTGKVIAASVGLSLFFIVLFRDKDGFIFLIDHANLAFHEAGHPIFGLLGNTLGLYGGTIGQLVFPSVVLIVFWAKREAVGFVVAGVWLFENFLNISRYMADARAQVLPLVGGGGHDWANIFTRWGVLSLDTTIAAFVKTVGWLGMSAMWAWLIRRWHKDSTQWSSF